MTDTDSDSTTDSDPDTDASIARRSLLAGLVGLGVLSTADRAAAASTTLEFGGNYTGDPGANYGLRLAPSNARFGLLGFSDASDGRGVVGRATASSGTTIGVIGRSDSSSDGATGLMGFNDAGSGRTYGFRGRSDSTEGRGALGIATADSGNTIGLEGRADSPNGVGMSGTNTASSGTTYGVRGKVNSPDGYGLYTPDDAKVEGVIEVTDVDTTGSDFTVEAGTTADGNARNVVQGHASNDVKDSAEGAVIGGGGFDDGSTVRPNEVYGHHGTIGGGLANQAGIPDSDPQTGRVTTVAGGTLNTAEKELATIGGGSENTAHGYRSTIAGGHKNITNGADPDAEGATVGGGWFNAAQGRFATISGGAPTSPYSLPIDTRNVAWGNYSAIGGGGENRTGTAAQPTADYATVAGGRRNGAEVSFATVGGGDANTASGNNATVGGGWVNTASGGVSTIGGGSKNTASGPASTIGGGDDNTAGGANSTIPGGKENTADGDYSFAAGFRANTNGHAGAFVLADSSSSGIAAQNDDEVRSQMPMYAPTFNATSARSEKTAIEAVDPEETLAGVESLAISTWQFEHDGDGRHIGPMAEDFHDAFGLDGDEETIATVDADGVALAAIQGLSNQLDDRDQRIDDLEAENERLRTRLETLEDRVDAMECDGGHPETADD